MALYDGLVEYDGKTLAPRPALAETWEVNDDSSELTFHLRHNGRWSNGDPIDANDFVYSFRRALSKELASRNAYLAYYIKNAQAYNAAKMFVRDQQTGKFLFAKDFADEDISDPLSLKPLSGGTNEYSNNSKTSSPLPIRRFIKRCIRRIAFHCRATPRSEMNCSKRIRD